MVLVPWQKLEKHVQHTSLVKRLVVVVICGYNVNGIHNFCCGVGIVLVSLERTRKHFASTGASKLVVLVDAVAQFGHCLTRLHHNSLVCRVGFERTYEGLACTFVNEPEFSFHANARQPADGFAAFESHVAISVRKNSVHDIIAARRLSNKILGKIRGHHEHGDVRTRARHGGVIRAIAKDHADSNSTRRQRPWGGGHRGGLGGRGRAATL